MSLKGYSQIAENRAISAPYAPERLQQARARPDRAPARSPAYRRNRGRLPRSRPNPARIPSAGAPCRDAAADSGGAALRDSPRPSRATGRSARNPPRSPVVRAAPTGRSRAASSRLRTRIRRLADMPVAGTGRIDRDPVRQRGRVDWRRITPSAVGERQMLPRQTKQIETRVIALSESRGEPRGRTAHHYTKAAEIAPPQSDGAMPYSAFGTASTTSPDAAGRLRRIVDQPERHRTRQLGGCL